MNVRSFAARLYAGALLVALGCAQVAHASKLPDFKQTGATTTGNTAKIGMTGNGTTWGSTIPISPNVGGWTYAGNYGVPNQPKGTTMNMSASGDVFFSGTKYPFQAGYTVDTPKVWDGLVSAASVVGGMAGGPIGLGLLVASQAAPYIKQWFDESGLRVKPDGSHMPQAYKPYSCTTAPCYEYRGNAALPWRTNPETACQEWVVMYQSSYYYVGIWDAGSGNFQCLTKWKSNNNNNNFLMLRQARGVDTDPWRDLPSMSDISPYMTPRSWDPRVVSEILEKGGDIPMPSPTVTGPTTINGPTETTINADGSKTVKQTESKYSISGDTITNISNITTVTNYNSSNQIISTSTITINPPSNKTEPQNPCAMNPGSVGCAPRSLLDDLGKKLDDLLKKPDPKTDCEKTPDAVGCAKFGDPAPADTIQKETKPVSITPVSFTGGSCPAPVQFSVFGHSYEFTYTTLCEKLAALSSLFLALAGLTAAWIFTSGFRV